jgi:hypothetical protein
MEGATCAKLGEWRSCAWESKDHRKEGLRGQVKSEANWVQLESLFPLHSNHREVPAFIFNVKLTSLVTNNIARKLHVSRMV